MIGPRPESPDRVKHYSEWQCQRLNVKPGMSGLAQVCGLREEHSSEEKARFDLQYMMHSSLFFDISLILQTGWTLIGKTIAPEQVGFPKTFDAIAPVPQILWLKGLCRVLIVRSPVRISFGGGGTDLPSYYEQFGGSVLSAAINKYFYTILGARSDGRVQVISSDLRVFENWQDIANMPVRISELEIPLAVLKELGSKVSVDLFLASEIPPGTGLGSSASVCVNILQTLTSYLHTPLSKYELAERAFHIARNVLGKHVGKQDEYAAAFGGLNFLSFNQDGSTQVEALDLDAEVLQEFQSNLMLFFTGAAHHSWTILQEQEAFDPRSDQRHIRSSPRREGFGIRMRDALQRAQLQVFGELLHAAWEAKRRVSEQDFHA